MRGAGTPGAVRAVGSGSVATFVQRLLAAATVAASNLPVSAELSSAASSEALTLVGAVGVEQQLGFFLPQQPSQSLPLPTPRKSGFFRHFAANANPVCSKWAVSAWNRRQRCPKLGRVSVSPGCLSQRGKGVAVCSLALCPGSLEKPALLDIYPQLGCAQLSLCFARCQCLAPRQRNLLQLVVSSYGPRRPRY